MSATVACFDAAAIARAATIGPAAGADEAHFGECLTCRRQLAAERATRDALRALPVPALAPARRASLAAEILAEAQFLPAPRRTPIVPVVVTSVTALAAAAALVLAWPRSQPHATSLAVDSSTDEIAMATHQARPTEAPPSLSAPLLEASAGATLRHTVGSELDEVTLVEGTLTLDSREARDVDVKVGDSVVHVADAAVTIRAHQRRIVSVQVTVGAARVDGRDQHIRLERDSLWLPGPSAKAQSLAAFRDAWLALRAGKNREAIALFDRVTDPVALEEATYWAAVAAERAGDSALAAKRFAKFHRLFPDSKYFTGEEKSAPLQP